MNIPPIVWTILAIVTAVLEVMSGICFFIAYSQYPEAGSYVWKLKTGCPPMSDDVKYKDGRYCYKQENGPWLGAYITFMFGIGSFILAAIELLIIFFPSIIESFFPVMTSIFGRGLIIFLKSMATWGVANDMGIAIGSLEMVVGVLYLAWGLLQKFVFGGGGGDAKAEE